MAIIVREEIHDDKIELTSVQNQVFSIIILFGFIAENTSIVFIVKALNVFQTPGRPHVVHF